MSDSQIIVDQVDPRAAYDILTNMRASALVDVRTTAEWTFVGVPDLSGISRPVILVEWAQFPNMTPNPDFVGELQQQAGGTLPERLLFLCRSGQRSLAAARRVAAEMADAGAAIHCTNIAEGFEGDRDGEGHRGTLGGWRKRGLPWVQG